MVKIVHRLVERVFTEGLECNFLLSNKRGGYYLEYDSRYCGMHIPELRQDGWSLFKSIDSIRINTVPNVVMNRFYAAAKKSVNTVERYFLFKNSLLYEVRNYSGLATLNVDFREVYDFSTQDRIHHIYEEDGFVVIEYDHAELRRYLVIKSEADISELGRWVEKNYSLAEKRGSANPNLWIYEAVSLSIDKNAKTVFTYCREKEVGMRECEYVFEHSEFLKKEERRRVSDLVKNAQGPNPWVRQAYRCCVKSLDSLDVDVEGFKGLYAGLPWFFHFWLRDEAVSAKAMFNRPWILQRLKRFISQMRADGLIESRYPPTKLVHADAPGWAFFRIGQYISQHKLGDEEIRHFKDQLLTCLSGLLAHHTKDGFAINGPKETWMDTAVNGDTREGIRIEIQALRLAMYSLAVKLCRRFEDPRYKSYQKLEKELAVMVRENFYVNDMIFDGFGDESFRPNIFLTYYVYPQLFGKQQWKKAFKKALDNLWMSWGGLSSIGKNNPLFQPYYTGEDNRSYHRGDSWFYINYIAAICMYRLDKKIFADYIQRIIKAGCTEILTMGVPGAPAEISSASELRSEGCMMQAWSAAAFIELIDEIYG